MGLSWSGLRKKPVSFRRALGTVPAVWRRPDHHSRHQRAHRPHPTGRDRTRPQPVPLRGGFCQLAGSMSGKQEERRQGPLLKNPAHRQPAPAAHCAFPPRPCCAVVPISGTSIASYEHDWERPRPSLPRLTNWPALSITCSLQATLMTKPSSKQGSENKTFACKNAYKSMLNPAASNSSPSPHEVLCS